MAGISRYEREEIRSVLCPKRRSIVPGHAVHLCPTTYRASKIFDAAVLPAFHANDLHAVNPQAVFDSDSAIASACKHLQSAEIILADLTGLVPDVLYVLGLAHALGRCPLLLTDNHPAQLPFDLRALRCLQYDPNESGLRRLREELTRALRTFLACTRVKPRADDDPRDDVT
jgi:hypothetical protein